MKLNANTVTHDHKDRQTKDLYPGKLGSTPPGKTGSTPPGKTGSTPTGKTGSTPTGKMTVPMTNFLHKRSNSVCLHIVYTVQ